MVKTPPFQCKGLPCGSAGKESACNAEVLTIFIQLSSSGKDNPTSGNHKSDLFFYEFICLFLK